MNYIVESKNSYSFVTLAEAKNQLNILASETDDDTHIQTLLNGAVSIAEKYTGRFFRVATVKLKVFENGYFDLPYYDVIDVLTVKDQGGVDVSYTYDAFSKQINITGVFDSHCIVTYTVGQETPDDIVKMAVLRVLSDLYVNREDNIAGASLNTISVGAYSYLDSVKLRGF